MNRREFVEGSVKSTIAMAAISSIPSNAQVFNNFRFTQVALPYAYNALEPYIDTITMDIHYNRHHAAYVKNAHDAFDTEKISVKDEFEFFSNISRYSMKARNNGGGVWNHNFFWNVMKPAGGSPQGKVVDALTGAFGSVEKFKELFSAAGIGRFGSGWAWLVQDEGKLKIGSTANQDNPLMPGLDIKGTPLLAIDVWEHAYYLKYQNKRSDYISQWWSVVNWDEVAKKLE